MITSWFDLSYAHVHHHGSFCVVSFDECGEVTAVNLLHVLQVRFAVVGHHLRALLMNIQATIWGTHRQNTVNTLQVHSSLHLFHYSCQNNKRSNKSANTAIKPPCSVTCWNEWISVLCVQRSSFMPILLILNWYAVVKLDPVRFDPWMLSFHSA